MLKIFCPYCKEYREEEEFSYAGEANIKRPDNIDDISDEEFGRYLYFRKNTKGVHHEMWVHTMACRKYFNVIRDTVSYEILGSEKLKRKTSDSRVKEGEEVCV
ncbi:MAG: sarcosine oxidase subunit delta [Coxiellaceae bacterium]|nr:sarcosine oxidase subunit delta [Coxiellaceae bacterium]